MYGVGTSSPGSQFIAGMYNDGVQSGIVADDVSIDEMRPFETKRFSIEGVEYVEADVKPSLKLFVWKSIDNPVPMAETTEIK